MLRRSRLPRSARGRPGRVLMTPARWPAARRAPACDLPEPETPVIGDQALQRHVDRHVLQVVQRRAAHRQPARCSRSPCARSRRHRLPPARRGCSGCTSGCARKRPVTESGAAAMLGRRVPCATSRPPRLPAPGPMSMMWSARRIVSSSCSTTTSVLPLSPSLCSAFEQDLVVARVQADGRLVEHVADALQVAAELRRQADALRLAARERGRAAVQREVAEAHLFQELEPAPDLGDQVARDLGVARASEPACSSSTQLARIGHRPLRDPGDRVLVEGDARDACVQARAGAVGARLVGHALDLGLLAREALLAALVVVVAHRVVEGLALLARQLHAGADAVGAPAVLAVVAEQARVELGVAGAADRAGALGREHLHLADLARRRAGEHRAAQAVERRQQVHHALADVQRLGEQLAQLGLVVAASTTRSPTGSSIVCSLKRSMRGHGSTEELAVDAQVRVAARLRPVGEVGVDALAGDHQRRQQADVLAGVVAQDLRGDALGALRPHRRAVLDAVLHAELDVQQAQEVPDLGGRADRALAAAARQALLDRHGRRDAVDRVDLGPAGRLHDAARVGVERFEVAPLAFVEQDVEGQRRLARAARRR